MQETENTVELVIISGMSGAGKTVAVQAFEDLGYFCIDNMPPALIPKFWELLTKAGTIKKVALVVDLRSRAFYDQIVDILNGLENSEDVNARVLFLDATDTELVSRYKETRRAHPLAMEGRLMDGITKERELLRPLRNHAEVIIDTTNLSPRELREELFASFKNKRRPVFHLEVMSFGFKYGLPLDADIVMDVRFLPNPYYVPELKEKNGTDPDVYDYVMKNPLAESFFKQYDQLLHEIMPEYIKEGKTSLTIAIGCTGGQHRSVAFAERIGASFKDEYPVDVTHRDMDKRKETVNRS
ncbi:RNase adapter RapZ [Lacticaseibacillus zhaodongensis]|uniref:RNase adapter RapZ n=1 Tax=Lacticaseibacillus zhaodongensis TaxID=2668065 RepID=UPI0022A8FED9|nr:RNase adapter RapZ [Lacticaseibacillus zhaodongensis]